VPAQRKCPITEDRAVDHLATLNTSEGKTFTVITKLQEIDEGFGYHQSLAPWATDVFFEAFFHVLPPCSMLCQMYY
jgi:hypothetical protein